MVGSLAGNVLTGIQQDGRQACCQAQYQRYDWSTSKIFKNYNYMEK